MEILVKLEYKKILLLENKRNIYSKNSKVIFYSIPSLPDIMETESKDKRELNEMIKLFNVKIDELKTINHLNLYGIELNIPELKFTNLKKLLGPLIIKNKAQFNSIIKDQLVLVKKINK